MRRPRNFWPSSQNDRCPRLRPSDMSYWLSLMYVPRSQTMTRPAPYWPSGITPSKVS